MVHKTVDPPIGNKLIRKDYFFVRYFPYFFYIFIDKHRKKTNLLLIDVYFAWNRVGNVLF